MENFELSWFSNDANIQKLTVSNIKDIRLEFVHKSMQYVKTKTAVIENNKLTYTSHLEQISDRIIFTKEEKYTSDKEYRIVFSFSHPNYGILPVRKEPVILPLNPLNKWLRYP